MSKDPVKMLIQRGQPVLQPSRVRVGHCPGCKAVLVVLNNYGPWPYVKCSACGWTGGTSAMSGSIRLEKGGVIMVDSRVDLADWGFA